MEFTPKGPSRGTRAKLSATKDQRVINFAVPCVLKSNFLDYSHVYVSLAAAVTTKHLVNVAVISSSNFIFDGQDIGSQLMGNHATCLYPFRSRDLLRKQGFYEK